MEYSSVINPIYYPVESKTNGYIDDLYEKIKKQQQAIDKARKYFEENYYDCLDFNSGKKYKKLYHPEKLYELLKEVSEWMKKHYCFLQKQL